MPSQLAGDYLEFFEFDLDGGSMAVVLSLDAPQPLRELAAQVCDGLGTEHLVCVFEALNAVAEAGSPDLAEIDEKVCPLEIYKLVLDFLSRRA